MPALTNKQKRLLRPYLIGERPKENGEWDMFCPLHGPESSRSASLNARLGDWYCFAGCGGGGVADLIKQRERWVAPPSPDAISLNGGRSSSGKKEEVTNAHVAGWHSALMSNDERLEYLEGRGISVKTVESYQIGWDKSRHVYSIPVRGAEGELCNVRRYNPNPLPGRPKVRSVTGMGSPPRLYPLSILETVEDYIIIGEGEWDALCTIQRGFPTITRTASADTWKNEWTHLFKGLRVYLAHDADEKGVTANLKIGKALEKVADVRLVKFPYEVVPSGGKDLSDFWKEHSKDDFQALLDSATKFGANKPEAPTETERITVMDSFDAKRVGRPVELNVTIKGRREPGYSIPKKVFISCTRDAGVKCNFCPLNPAGGEARFSIEPDNPRILAMLDINQAEVMKQIAHEYGVPGGKCARLSVEVEEHQAVEVLLGRPSLDEYDGSKTDSYKNITITSAGRHDTLPNNTMAITGALYANPRTQSNSFLAWDMQRTETSVDHFEITPEAIELMRIFQTSKDPLKKIRHIADEMSAHVTHIIGRPEMHALMDLTFHSVLSFHFAKRLEKRGWLDCLVIGDTRTGKSEAAAALVRHYGVGEIISGEMASVAGIIGGAQQIAGRADWMIAWGAVPLNDKRLVVIDEASGLSHDDISAMSDVRASGVAKITKIVAEATYARTRLLWLSNPRNARMSDFTYGVDAIRPLIGNNEDIARFDLAMAVSQGDVPTELINVAPSEGTLEYSSRACHLLALWVWTREANQIVWAPEAERTVLAAANAMGRRYVEDPPLIQAANIRLKIARTAIAIAARLFSTDDSYQNIVVHPKHVEAAVAFMDRLYSMGIFGYTERSKERIADAKEAESKIEEIRVYLNQRPGLAKFLRSRARFRRQDLEEVLDASREVANATINTLWEARMVRKEQADICAEPTLHQLLREGSE